MTDDVLTPVAEALVKTLLEFREHAEQASEILEDLRESVEKHEQELEQDWTSFTEAVESLLRVVDERGETLEPKGDEAGTRVGSLGSLTTQVQESVVESLGENAEILGGLAEQAQGADVETERLVAEGAESVAERVGEQLDKVADGVETTAHDGVDSIRNGFVTQAEGTAMEAEMLVKEASKILTDNATWVKQTVVAWTSQMVQVEDSVALEGFRKAGPNAVAVVEHAIDTYSGAQQLALDQLERVVGEARQELQELQQAVEESNGTLHDASEEISSQTADFVAALRDAGDALQKVADLMTAFGVM